MFSCCYFMTEARTETLPYLKSITSLKLLLSLTAEMNEQLAMVGQTYIPRTWEARVWDCYDFEASLGYVEK